MINNQEWIITGAPASTFEEAKRRMDIIDEIIEEMKTMILNGEIAIECPFCGTKIGKEGENVD